MRSLSGLTVRQSTGTGGRREGRAPFGILDQALDRVGECIGVGWFDEYTVLAVVDDLGQATRPSRDDGHATGQRLEADEETDAFAA